jgi:AraC-like DNA-binding protein/quercetin dioxygenase-like cupin family protein
MARAGNNTTPDFKGELVSSLTGEVSDWHKHEFGQLVSAQRGSLLIGTRRRVLILTPAMAIWIPPYAEHWSQSNANNEMLYVDVDRSDAEGLGADCRIIAMTPLLTELMQATLPTARKKKSGAHQTAIDTLLQEEVCAAPDVPLSIILPSDRRLAGLARQAFENPGAFVSVVDWLGSAAASRKTIERIFVSETGMTPSQWLRHARLMHAIIRLAAGEKVGTVALDVGYESPSAFSFMFRQTVGKSPREFGRIAEGSLGE